MTWRVLITCPPMIMTLDQCQERFRQEGFEIHVPEFQQQMSEAALCELIAEFDGVIAGDDPFSGKVLEIGRQGKLKALAKWGIGVDAIALDRAKELGIFTSNTPNVFGDEVADVALGYTILLARQLHRMDSAVQQGKWLKVQGTSLRGKVAGIIGVGSIGRAIARRFQVLGLELLGYDVFPIDAAFCQETGLQSVSLTDLWQQADVVVLACNLTPDNFHLLDQAAFEQMKKGVWIVNVARGGLIDESALIPALESGQVAAAALDVFESEPLAADHPLNTFDQVIRGSHNSSNTREAVLRVNQIAIDNLVRDLNRAAAGETP
ncbi:phosphoglycerate dehydrogenase [Vacuolonema iberomarrocanum]|uniref:phosphoglycerate dehydrogenase n=1 Tax=Vacuolonema iberomarrocanum TaxID=3454632 RepID=UPI0019E227D0|nr:phosphoglycerate dehydrogenase [filamentous cyanobacterium LEGE 07170]